MESYVVYQSKPPALLPRLWLDCARPTRAPRQTIQMPVLLAAPEKLGHWPNESTLSFPGGNWEPRWFICLLCVEQEGRIYNIYHYKSSALFYPRQLDSAGPIRAPGLGKHATYLGIHGKVGWWMCRSTLSLSKEYLCAGIFLSAFSVLSSEWIYSI